MMRMVAGFVMLFFLSFTAGAQQDEKESEKENKGKLPPIVLPEFDIEGKEQPDPPDFSKGELSAERGYSATISGQNLNERESAILSQERKPELPSGTVPGSLTGKAVAGYGRFVTPSFEAWVGRTGKKVDVHVSGKYSSSDGHVAFSNFRRGGLDASISWKFDSKRAILRDARVNTFAGFESERYRFYGSLAPSLVRSIRHGSAGVTTVSSFEPWNLTYEARVRWHSYAMRDVSKTTENEFSVSLVGSKVVGRVNARADAEIAVDVLNSLPSYDNPALLSLSVEGQGSLFPGFQLKGGMWVYSLKNADTDARVRLYPQVEVRYFAGSRVIIFAKANPGVRKASLRRLVGENPYLANTIAIRHQENVTDFSGGIELALSARARGRVAVSYRRSREYPVVVDSDQNGMWEISYGGRTRIFLFAADVSLQASSSDQFLGSFRLLNSEYSVASQRVPYLPSAVVTGTYQRRIGSRLNVQGSVQYVGRRYSDLGATQRLKSYVRVDVRGEYYFSRSIGLYLSTENLLDDSYAVWEHYVARPFYIQAGLTAKW